MSSSSTRRRGYPIRRQPVTAAVDVGCACKRSKLFSSLFSSSSSSSLGSSFRRTTTSKPKHPKPSPNHYQPTNNRRHPLSSYYPFSPSGSAGWDTSRDLSVSSTNTTATVATTFSGPSDYSSPPPVPPQQPARRSKKKTAAAEAAAAAAASPARSGSGAAGVGRVAEESVAVVKESSDPYHDFRDSMLQMIVEKELYGWDDLRGLLHRFLTLNSPCHHDAILRAFSEIWAGVYYGGGAGGGQVGGGGPVVEDYAAVPQQGNGGGQRRRRSSSSGTAQHRRSRAARDHGRDVYAYGGAGDCPNI